MSLWLKIKNRYFRKQWLASADAGFWFFLSLAFFGSMIWAVSRDPFERVWFNLKTAQGEKIKAVAVLPKPVRPMPTVVYIYGSGGSLITSGTALRQMAELGVATVTIEYNQTNRAAFEAEFAALLDWLPKQKWTQNQPVAWLGASLGAQNTLSFLSKHPEKQPSLYVRLGGGLPEGWEKLKTQNLKFKTLLVHGENDEIFPSADARKLAEMLRQSGVETELKIIPGRGHVFDSDRGLLTRCLGEKIKSLLTPEHPTPEFPITKNYLFILCILPAFLWSGFWFYLRKQLRPKEPEDLSPPSLFEKILRCTAVVLAVAAVTQSAWHMIPPRLAVSENTLAIARKSLIAPKWTEDFDALAHEPYWRGQKTKTLLTHVELANYCVYELINWKLDTNIYRQYVLSPVIEKIADVQAAGEKEAIHSELNWRRPLWEFYYPRIRKENDTSSAAAIVARTLRERITIDPKNHWPDGIESIWKNQIATPQGFERIYVATLRSTGVPARLDKNGKAEFWTGTDWKTAPRPLIETWLQ